VERTWGVQWLDTVLALQSAGLIEKGVQVAETSRARRRGLERRSRVTGSPGHRHLGARRCPTAPEGGRP